MSLSRITCSGIREFAPFDKIINILNLSEKVEFSVISNSITMKSKTDGNEWLFELLDLSSKMSQSLNIKIHLTDDWGQLFGSKGIIPADILDWFFNINMNNGKPVVKNWQIDLDKDPNLFNLDKVSRIISNNPELEFSFLYHPALHRKFSRLKDMNIKFSLLYGTEYAYNNKSRWSRPVFDTTPQGYLGGINGNNVDFNLDKINALVPQDLDFWIEANKTLINKSDEFDFNYANYFVKNALAWSNKFTK